MVITRMGSGWLLVAASALAVAASAGCNKDEGGAASTGASSAASGAKLPYIDIQVKLAADLPSGWAGDKMLCLVKDETSTTGVSEFKGCLYWRVGKADDKGNVGLIDNKIELYAVPKDKTADFDQKKDSNVLKTEVVAGEYAVYAKTNKGNDPDVQKVLTTLKHQP